MKWKTLLTFGIAALGASDNKRAVTAGTLLSMLVESVEHAKGDGNGFEKEEAVVLAFASTLALAENMTSRELLDDLLFQDAVRKAIKAIVAVQNIARDIKDRH